MNLMPGLQQPGGFNASPSTIFHLAPKGSSLRWGSLFAMDHLDIFQLKYLLHWQYSELQEWEITVKVISL